MATNLTPSFDFNVWLSMPSVVQAWKGTNLPYDHREALHLAAMVKLLRRQQARARGGEWGAELAQEIIGLALACALPSELVEYLDGDHRAVPELERLVLRHAKGLALRAMVDLESSVETSASELLSRAQKTAA